MTYGEYSFGQHRRRRPELPLLSGSAMARALIVIVIALGALTATIHFAHADATPAFTGPALTGPVVDTADTLLASDKARIAARLATLEKDSGATAAVAVVDDLGGAAIDAYAGDLFRGWRLDKTGKGLLLLVASGAHQLRIVAGPALSDRLTNDAKAMIIARDIVPALQDADLAKALWTGLGAIDSTLKSSPAEVEAAVASWNARNASASAAGPLISLLASLAVGVLLLALLVRGRLFPKRERNGDPSSLLC